MFNRIDERIFINLKKQNHEKDSILDRRCVIVDGNLSAAEGHKIAHNVKDNIIHSEPRVQDVLVHTEPDKFNASIHLDIACT